MTPIEEHSLSLPLATYVVARELLDNLAHMGFTNIVVIASHGEPVHQIAVEKAIKRVNKHYGIRAISPLGEFFSLDELGIEHLSPKLILEMVKNIQMIFILVGLRHQV